MTAWHVTTHDLRDYRAGGGEPAYIASIEAHLLHCPDCRAAFASLSGATTGPGPDTERRWAALADRVDDPGRQPLARLGVSTRPLRGALLVALLLVLVLPLVLAGVFGAPLPTVLLALAPGAPVLAVAVAYRADTDPAGEIAAATPMAGLRVVAARALLVSLVAVPTGVAGALLVGLPTSVALGWVLPGLALAGAVLVAGTTRLDPGPVAAALGTAWAVMVLAPTGLGRVPAADVVDQVASTGTQLAALVLTVLTIALALTRHDRVVDQSPRRLA